jgi:pimeloyl-ACP methyl ester carboxylesterase
VDLKLREKSNSKHMKKFTFTITLIFATLIAFAQNPAIYIEKIGNGDPILFLPGFTTPGSVWDETIEQLPGNYVSIKVSYAGFNSLPAIEMPWYETIKTELIEYIQEENLNKITIIGHSMGGMLAIDLAESLPDRIHKLVLVDALPSIRALMMPGVPAEAIQYESPYNTQMLAQSDAEIQEMAKMMSQNMTYKADRVEELTKWVMEADRKTYVYGYTDLLKLDLRESLKSIKIPTLILGASFPDKDVVRKNYDEQFANLSEKEILIAPESKHFIMFDEPAWFYSSLNKFLAK